MGGLSSLIDRRFVVVPSGVLILLPPVTYPISGESTIFRLQVLPRLGLLLLTIINQSVSAKSKILIPYCWQKILT